MWHWTAWATRAQHGMKERPGAAALHQHHVLSPIGAWGAAGPRSEPAQQHEAPTAAPHLAEDAGFAQVREAAGRGNMMPLFTFD